MTPSHPTHDWKVVFPSGVFISYYLTIYQYNGTKICAYLWSLLSVCFSAFGWYSNQNERITIGDAARSETARKLWSRIILYMTFRLIFKKKYRNREVDGENDENRSLVLNCSTSTDILYILRLLPCRGSPVDLLTNYQCILCNIQTRKGRKKEKDYHVLLYRAWHIFF